MNYRCFMFVSLGGRPRTALDIEAGTPSEAASIFINDLFPGNSLAGPIVSAPTEPGLVAWSVLTDLENKRLYINCEAKNDH